MITSISLKSEDAVDLDIGPFLLVIIEIVTTTIHSIVLRTLGEIDNGNQMIVSLVEGCRPFTVVDDAVSTEVQWTNE